MVRDAATVINRDAAFVVRSMQAEDVPFVALLCGELGYPAEPPDVLRRFERIACRDDAAVFVAQSSAERVVGWTHVYIECLLESDGRAELGGLVVSENGRGRGVGRALITAAENWARERGCTFLRLRSNVLRDGAHAFYEHLGYTHFKTQKNFRKSL